MCSWSAGCGGSRTSGSEGGGEETTGRKADTGASPPTLRVGLGYRGAPAQWNGELSVVRICFAPAIVSAVRRLVRTGFAPSDRVIIARSIATLKGVTGALAALAAVLGEIPLGAPEERATSGALESARYALGD